jgi:hypothetical protein
MLAFAMQHQFWVAVVFYWIFSAAVSSMPDPAANGAPAYLWLFRFLHTIAGNLTTAFANRIPGARTLILLITVPLFIAAWACAAAHPVHPAPPNLIDSTIDGTLLVAETAIEGAHTAYEAGLLPESTRSAFDTLVRSYDVAHQSWLTYRSAIATNVPEAEYFDQLNRNLIALNNAIRAFVEAEGKGKLEQ